MSRKCFHIKQTEKRNVYIYSAHLKWKVTPDFCMGTLHYKTTLSTKIFGRIYFRWQRQPPKFCVTEIFKTPIFNRKSIKSLKFTDIFSTENISTEIIGTEIFRTQCISVFHTLFLSAYMKSNEWYVVCDLWE